MSIDNHVVVNISKETSAPSQVGFGTTMILSLEADLLGSFAAVRTKTYDIATALADLVADGFTTGSQTYKAVQAVASQSPRPTQVKVGKRAVSVAQVNTNTIEVVANNTTYTTTINGIPYTYLSDADALNTEIRDGLVAAINAGDEPVAAANGAANTYTITADNAGQPFSNAVDANQSVANTTANVGPVSEMILNQEEDNDFYFVGLDVNAVLTIELMAAYIETQMKVFAYSTDDANSKDLAEGADADVSLMKKLKSLGYDRTFGVWCPTGDLAEHKHLAWVGLQSPKRTGSSNWAYQTVNGATSDSFTTTEKKNIEDKNGNTYTTVAGLDIFFAGKMASGEFIDITIGVDWITARVKEKVFGHLVSSEKVPYDDGGIESIGAQVQTILSGPDGAEQRLILVAGSSATTVPTRSETTVADRAARILRNVKFTGELAGAINKIFIDGTVTV